MTPPSMLASLVQPSDHVRARTRARLEGLTDDELLWVPAPEVTTIAWRLGHMCACHGARRNRQWLGMLSEEVSDRFDNGGLAAVTAAQALAELEAAQDEWRAVLHALDDTILAQKLGPVAGPFAEATKGDFVLHQLDEAIHHGAEVALLRDLWRTRAAAG